MHTATIRHSASLSHLPLAVQRPPADPEQARRAALVSTRQPQDALDVALLEGAQIRDLPFLPRRRRDLLQSGRRWRQPLQVLATNRPSLRQRGGAFEQVLELANVAREVVREKGGVRVAVERRR